MATMHDVARAAGVSLKTVSRVVNNEEGVRPETAARVHAAIAALGFRPNAVARSLRAGRSLPLLGLIIGDLVNPFYSAIAYGVEEEAARHGHLVIIGSSKERSAQEQDLVAALLGQHVAGLLVVPAGDRAVAAEAPSIPAVYLDRPAPCGDADAVVLDNHGGALRAVTHLIEAGHTRIGVVGYERTLFAVHERLQGYRAALAAHGIAWDQALIQGGTTVERAAAGAVHVLALPSPPTALLAVNNRACVGALRTVLARRAATAVLGFDSLELAEMLPALYALVVHDPVDMGRIGARLLFARMAGDESPWRTVTLPTVLTVYHR